MDESVSQVGLYGVSRRVRLGGSLSINAALVLAACSPDGVTTPTGAPLLNDIEFGIPSEITPAKFLRLLAANPQHEYTCTLLKPAPGSGLFEGADRGN